MLQRARAHRSSSSTRQQQQQQRAIESSGAQCAVGCSLTDAPHSHRLAPSATPPQHDNYGGPAAVLRGGLHQESLPGRQPAQRPSPPHHAEGGGELPAVPELLQVCSERNCTQNEENSCHLDVRGWFYFTSTFPQCPSVAANLSGECR